MNNVTATNRVVTPATATVRPVPPSVQLATSPAMAQDGYIKKAAPKPELDNKAKFHRMAQTFGWGVTACLTGMLPLSLASMGIVGAGFAATVGLPLIIGGGAVALYAYIRGSEMPRK